MKTAKQFLLDSYFSDQVPTEEKEMWYNTNHWPSEVVDIIVLYKDQLLNEVKQILIDEVRGYEGCAFAIEKVNQLNNQL